MTALRRVLLCALVSLLSVATSELIVPAVPALAVPTDVSPVQLGYAHNRVYVKGTDGRLWWQRTTLSPPGWHYIPGMVGSGPSVVDLAPGAAPDNPNVRLFVRGNGGALLVGGQLGLVDLPWSSLGGVLTAAPAADWSDRFGTWVAVRGSDGAIYVKDDSLGVWSGWSDLGGVGTSAPSITINDDVGVYVSVRGTDGQIWQRRADVSDAWRVPLPGVTTNSKPDTTFTLTPTGWQQTITWRDADNALWLNDAAGTRKLDDTAVSSAPTNAATWTTGLQREIYVRGTDNAAWRLAVDPTGATTWTSYGGVVA